MATQKLFPCRSLGEDAFAPNIKIIQSPEITAHIHQSNLRNPRCSPAPINASPSKIYQKPDRLFRLAIFTILPIVAFRANLS